MDNVKDGMQAARSQSELLHAELSVLKQEMGGLGLRPVASEPALMHRQRSETPSRPQTSEPREVSFRGPSVVPPKFRSAQVDVVRHQSDVAQRRLPSKQRVQLPPAAAPPPSSNKMTLTQHDAFTSYLESLGLNADAMRVQAGGKEAPRFAAMYNMRRTRMGSRNDARPLAGLAGPTQPFQMPMPGRAVVFSRRRWRAFCLCLLAAPAHSGVRAGPRRDAGALLRLCSVSPCATARSISEASCRRCGVTRVVTVPGWPARAVRPLRWM